MYCIKFIVKPHFPSTQKGHLTIKRNVLVILLFICYYWYELIYIHSYVLIRTGLPNLF
nr:MAG TPA: hypothetical protein [Bacteriophage sp.]